MCGKQSNQHRILYLGLELPSHLQGIATHCPLIEIKPRSFDSDQARAFVSELETCTHLLLTSKQACRILLQMVPIKQLQHLQTLAVGPGTAAVIIAAGMQDPGVAFPHTAEGCIELLDQVCDSKSKVAWPHAAAARPVIASHCEQAGIALAELAIYDTLEKAPPIGLDPEQFDEIHFTSPSTVKSFLTSFGKLPSQAEIISIGPITEAFLQEYRSL